MVGVGAWAEAELTRSSEEKRKVTATTGFMRGSIAAPEERQDYAELRAFLRACYIRQVLVSLGHPI